MCRNSAICSWTLHLVLVLNAQLCKLTLLFYLSFCVCVLFFFFIWIILSKCSADVIHANVLWLRERFATQLRKQIPRVNGNYGIYINSTKIKKLKRTINITIIIIRDDKYEQRNRLWRISVNLRLVLMIIICISR